MSECLREGGREGGSERVSDRSDGRSVGRSSVGRVSESVSRVGE